MDLLSRLSILALCLAVTSCMDEQADVALHDRADAPLTCAAGPDCDAKWARSKQWVEENSHWQIEKATDTVITVASVSETIDPVMSVKKTPVESEDGAGISEYRIVFTADCQSMLGCYPTALQVKASFAQFIDDTAPPDDAGNDNDLGITFISAGKNNGPVIATIEPGSSAAAAGLKPGDRIEKFNGKGVNSAAQFQGLASSVPSGSVFPLQISRGSKIIVMYIRG